MKEKVLINVMAEFIKSHDAVSPLSKPTGQHGWMAGQLLDIVKRNGYSTNPEVKLVSEGTAKAIDHTVSKYYADCYNTEADMHRLMLWESKLCRLAGVEYPYRGK